MKTKTTEQIKEEVVNYLTKTSMHTFIKPKATFKWGTESTPGHYEYDFENATEFKVIKNGDQFTIVDGDSTKLINVDNYVSYNGVNAKNVIKNHLFLDKKMKSVKRKK